MTYTYAWKMTQMSEVLQQELVSKSDEKFDLSKSPSLP